MGTVQLPTLGAVICTTGGRFEALRRTLRSLVSDDACTEIVIVVDGGGDGVVREARALSDDPRCTVLALAGVGPAAARSVGVEATTSDVVLLLDDDVVPEHGMVAAHARAHAAEVGLVAVGAMPVRTPDGGLAEGYASRLYAEAYDRWMENAADPAYVLANLWMGNVSLRRADALRVGLEEGAFAGILGHEDRDFGLRCRRAGLHGRFIPEARAAHLHSRTLRQFRHASWGQGAGLAILHRMHRDEIGPLPRDRFSAGLPAPLRVVVSSTRHEPVRAVATATLGGVIAGAQTIGALDRIGLGAARILRRVELQRGAQDMARSGRA